MAERANFELFRGTAIILRFQLTTPESAPDYVTGWETLFTVKSKDTNANTILSVEGSLSTVNNALRLGIFDVFLSAANTNALVDGNKYAYSFRRTNTGYNDVLTIGELTARTAS